MRPPRGRLYVYAVIVLGAVLMATALSSLQLPRPGLFAAFLVLSVILSALKVDMPIGVGQLLHLTLVRGRLHRAAPSRPRADDADCHDQRVVAVHVPDE